MSNLDSDALAGFDEWFGRILQGLSPAKRRTAARKLGQHLRRSNLARITANIQPDGGGMEPRKPRRDRRGRLRKKAGGKMFRKLRFAKNFAIDARPDSVEVKFKSGGAERLAAVHHFGLVGIVGKDRDGKAIKYRYPERRLLGFGAGDEQAALDVAIDLIEPATR